MTMLKNNPPICDIFGNPDLCCDKCLSLSSTEKFMIPWKSQEKNAVYWYKSYIWRLSGNRKKKSTSVSKFGG